MNAPLVTLFKFNLRYAERLLEGIPAEEWDHQPAAGVNPPGWIVGHLALVHDSGVGLLGGEKSLPTEWRDMYGPGSDPASENANRPASDALLTAFNERSRALLEAVQSIDLTTLTEPNPFAPLVETLPTKGDLLSHMLTTHFATHLGQLSTWRRLTGRPSLF